MFRENDANRQYELFNSFNDLHPKIQAMLEKSWAPLYYEHVFCQIDVLPLKTKKRLWPVLRAKFLSRAIIMK